MKLERQAELEPKIGGEMLLIGGSGFVGSETSSLLADSFEISSPTSTELDITDARQVAEYVSLSSAKTVWLNAAYTDVKKLKPDELLDQNSPAWKTNINGVINLSEACRQFGKFFVLTSTGYVFEEGNGPYTEDSLLPEDKEARIKLNSEYAITKMLGERRALSIYPEGTAVVRIDYPFGDLKNERDYLRKIIGMMDKGYPIMSDQIITPTYLPDLASSVDIIARKKLSGIFHVAANKTTPYDLALLINQKLNNHFEVKKGYVADYIEKYGVPAWPIKSGLSSSQTQKQLGIKFTTIEEALESYFRS